MKYDNPPPSDGRKITASAPPAAPTSPVPIQPATTAKTASAPPPDAHAAPPHRRRPLPPPPGTGLPGHRAVADPKAPRNFQKSQKSPISALTGTNCSSPPTTAATPISPGPLRSLPSPTEPRTQTAIERCLATDAKSPPRPRQRCPVPHQRHRCPVPHQRRPHTRPLFPPFNARDTNLYGGALYICARS